MNKWKLTKNVIDVILAIIISPLWIPCLLLLSPLIIYKWISDEADRQERFEHIEKEREWRKRQNEHLNKA